MVQGSTKRRLCFRCRSIDPSRGSPSRVALSLVELLLPLSLSLQTLPVRRHGTVLVEGGRVLQRANILRLGPIHQIPHRHLYLFAGARVRGRLHLPDQRGHVCSPNEAHRRSAIILFSAARPHHACPRHFNPLTYAETGLIEHRGTRPRLGLAATCSGPNQGPLRKTEKCWAARPSPPRGIAGRRGPLPRRPQAAPQSPGHHDRNLRAVYSPFKLSVAGWP